MSQESNDSVITCAVLLREEREPVYNTAEIAEIAASFLGQNRIDCRQSIRRSCGFVGRHLPQDKAVELQQALKSAKIYSIVLPEFEVVSVARIRRLSRIRLSLTGIQGQLTYRWLPEIPWYNFVAVHAYAFAEELTFDDQERRQKNKSADSLDAMSVKEDWRKLHLNMLTFERKRPSYRVKLCLDLFTHSPTEVYRIRHDSFHYDSLNYETQHSVESFHTLFAQLRKEFEVRRSEGMWYEPMRTAMAAKPLADLKLYLFEREEERNNSTSWLLQRLQWRRIWDKSAADQLGESLTANSAEPVPVESKSEDGEPQNIDPGEFSLPPELSHKPDAVSDPDPDPDNNGHDTEDAKSSHVEPRDDGDSEVDSA